MARVPVTPGAPSSALSGRAPRAAAVLLLTALLLTLAAWSRATPTTAATGARGVPILLYHHIDTGPRSGSERALHVPKALFARQMTALARAGYHPVTLDEVWDAWQGGDKLPSKPLVISFDDGYGSQYRSAFPVLKARGWAAVLNLIVRDPFPDPLTSTQVRRLVSAGWELDAHTLTHPDLTKVSDEQLADEVGGSRTALREQYGVPVNFLAYPYGHVDDRVAQAVRAAGYLGATTTRSGLATANGDPDRLPRIIVSPSTSGPALVAKLKKLR